MREKTNKIITVKEMRREGKTFQQIADAIGVSRQRAHQLYNKNEKRNDYYHAWTEKRCIFHSLRDWFNIHRFNTKDILEQIGLPVSRSNEIHLRRILNGDATMKKDDIDLLIGLTGMTYEELFREDKEDDSLHL